MIDFDLTDEQKALQKMARDFAEKEIRPIAEKLDRSENLLKDFPWDMVKKASRLGLRTIGLPKEYGGPEFDLRTWLVLIEELSYPDVSCAKILTQCWKGARRIGQQATKEQKDRFLPAFRDDDTYLLGGARTEPGSGSDNHLPYEAPDAGVKLTAKREGNYYVLNGRKHFISNSPVAKLLLVTARTDMTKGGDAGCSNFLVPTDTPGFKVASVHDKVGFRIYLQGELDFDNVKVPVENLFGGQEGRSGAEGVASKVELAGHAMTLSRAALDAAIKYANERIQGGRPIIQHQAVAMMIAEMYQTLQAGRTMLWRLAWMGDTGQVDPAFMHSTKVFCTEAALKICLTAMEVFGGSGVMRELPAQKFVRDAMVFQHMDGTDRAGEELSERYGSEQR
ncbi:MAG: acyl-CoA dehydrogenase family protein [Deltaproteobacteria bacterium]|nr:acyl-CoA dehydrogenase family protein [Deltaproteobacteria bacterium]